MLNKKIYGGISKSMKMMLFQIFYSLNFVDQKVSKYIIRSGGIIRTVELRTYINALNNLATVPD